MKEQFRVTRILHGGSPGIVEGFDLGAWFTPAPAMTFLGGWVNFTIDGVPEEDEFILGEVLVAECFLPT